MKKLIKALEKADSEYLLQQVADKVCDACHFLFPYQEDRQDLAELRIMKMEESAGNPADPSLQVDEKYLSLVEQLQESQSMIAQIMPIYSAAKALYKDCTKEEWIHYSKRKK